MTDNTLETETETAAAKAVVVLQLDVTPQPIPSYANVLADLDRVMTLLSLLATAPGDHTDTAAAVRLLERDDPAGEMRIVRLARVAYDYAYQLGRETGVDLEDDLGDLTTIIYDLAERGAGNWFPLRFEAPGVFATVLETAFARLRLEAGLDFFSSRQLARLARIDEKTVEVLLGQRGLWPEPSGVSPRELGEMSQGEYNYWHGQSFLFGPKDVPGWLATLPGFIPTRRNALPAAA